MFSRVAQHYFLKCVCVSVMSFVSALVLSRVARRSLRCVAVPCSVLQCATECCNETHLESVQESCHTYLLQCVAVKGIPNM